jgi:hypothetical protein
VARHGGEVDNPTVRRLTGQHPADITKLLGNLRDRGLLQMLGVKRGARYQLGPVAVPDGQPALTGGSTQSGEQLSLLLGGQDRGTEEQVTTDRTGVSSEDSRQESSELAPVSEDFVVSSEDSQPHSEDSPSSWEELLVVSAAARASRYLRAAARDDLIVDLCTRRSLALRELSALLGRDETTLREPIRALIASGRLRYRYPDRPTHRAQQYVATGQPDGEQSP